MRETEMHGFTATLLLFTNLKAACWISKGIVNVTFCDYTFRGLTTSFLAWHNQIKYSIIYKLTSSY